MARTTALLRSPAVARGRVGLLHPFGLALLAASAGLAWLVGALPDLVQWAGSGRSLLTIGAAAYLAAAAVVAFWPPKRPVALPVMLPTPMAKPVPRLAPVPPISLEKDTRRALRELNEPGKLARTPLLELLPALILDALGRTEDSVEPSPLEQGQALRTLAVDAIERLNVPGEGGKQALVYRILYLQYVKGLTIPQVEVQTGYAAQTIFRRSLEGVRAVGEDLWRREQRLAAAQRHDE